MSPSGDGACAADAPLCLCRCACAAVCVPLCLCRCVCVWLRAIPMAPLHAPLCVCWQLDESMSLYERALSAAPTSTMAASVRRDIARLQQEMREQQQRQEQDAWEAERSKQRVAEAKRAAAQPEGTQAKAEASTPGAKRQPVKGGGSARGPVEGKQGKGAVRQAVRPPRPARGSLQTRALYVGAVAAPAIAVAVGYWLRSVGWI
jgi:cobalamin biosynthesis Mg chelatase CobN